MKTTKATKTTKTTKLAKAAEPAKPIAAHAFLSAADAPLKCLTWTALSAYTKRSLAACLDLEAR